MNNHKIRIGRWKKDLQIASSWIQTPLIYMTFASLIYNNIKTIRIYFPRYSIYLIISGIFFMPLFKIIAKIIIKIGLYEAELDYDRRINPWSIYRTTPKERINLRFFSEVGKAQILILKQSELWDEVKKTYHPAWEEYKNLLEDSTI